MLTQKKGKKSKYYINDDGDVEKRNLSRSLSYAISTLFIICAICDLTAICL